MRSFTTSDLPGRCQRCWIRHEHCICGDLRPIDTRTAITVVRHIRESWKSTGTARVAALAVSKLVLSEYGEDAHPALDEVAALPTQGTYVLFPNEPATPWEDAKVERLVVLDGTWRQTRRMFQRLPALHGLPRLALPPKTAPVLRLRETAFSEGRSTLEAIADAIGLIEGEEAAAPLHALHALFVERVFRARGVWEQKLEDFAEADAE